MSSDRLLERPVVPVAGPEDAESTYSALRRHVAPEECRPFVIHVITDSDGGEGTETHQQRAREAVERFESLAAADGMAVDTGIYHDTPIAETIIDAAAEVDGSAILFCSRGGSAWFDSLVGGVRTSLVVKSDRPVVLLPTGD